jgi:cobalamin synthase
MKSEFGLMVFCNGVFVALYLLWNWAEYSRLQSLGNPVAVSTHFPWYIQFSTSGNAITVLFDTNFGLIFFLLAIFVNLYLAYRLQRSKNPSQNAPLPS